MSAADVSAQPLKLVTLAGFDRDNGMQGEPGYVAGTASCPALLIVSRQGLEREHLAAPMRANGNAVGDGVADQPPPSCRLAQDKRQSVTEGDC